MLQGMSCTIGRTTCIGNMQGHELILTAPFGAKYPLHFCFFGSRFSSNRCSLYLFFSSNFLNKNNKEKTRKKMKKTDFFPKEHEFLTETQRFPWQRAERPSRGDVSFPRGGAHRGLGALPGTLRARRHG